ncbi:MAG: MATE family efflux transporter [Lachnospiraceae bacterium]|nr:MATE family efflux transporter [Lachnospiraceae bacterium]MDD3660106.1 MATE family efflux transporter [Lachnospiraceae bacterium]
MTKDLTTGEPSKVLLGFSIPMLFSVMFQQLYNIADSVIAGKFAGVEALAAVGASYPVTMIFIAIATGSNIGCSILISQLFGAKDYVRMKTAIFTAIRIIILLSIILTLIGAFLCDPMIRALDTPDNIFQDASLYLAIYIWGLIFLFLYNICNGVFTALGDSKTPLFFLIASSIGNVILDYVFVAILHKGVAGVAWATFICQGVAAIISLITLLKRIKSIKTSEKPENFSWDILIKITRIAIPSILQQSFVSVGNLFVQRLVNGYGSTVIAAYSASIKLNTFAIVSFGTIGNAVSTYTAQNLGAGKKERIRKGWQAGFFIAVIIALPVIFLFFGAGKSMIGIFLEKGATTTPVLEEGIRFLRIVSPFYLIVLLKLVSDGVLRGAGAMKAFMISTFSDLLLRVGLSYFFALGLQLGTTGIWMSWPVGWIVGTALSLYYYKTGSWNQKNTEIYHN